PLWLTGCGSAGPALQLGRRRPRGMGTLVGDGRFRLGAQAIKCRRRCWVHEGTDRATGKPVAIKLESDSARIDQLPRERRAYQALASVAGVPRLLWSGKGEGVSIAVVERYGPSLKTLFHHCRSRFTSRVIADIAVQAFGILERIHAKGYIHRDVRPETLQVGLDSNLNQLHAIGLTTAKKYWHAKSEQHVPQSEEKAMMWNPIFASINAHFGRVLSRRDDLESVGYMIAYFFRGGLPWQDIPQSMADRHARILEGKQRMTVEELCEGCPPQMAVYIAYCRALRFDQRPDYAYLQSLLRALDPAPANDWPTHSFEHDWTVRPALSAGEDCAEELPGDAAGEGRALAAAPAEG
ncbi:unnamed protein product, partial [Prorocentrum cordatum]